MDERDFANYISGALKKNSKRTVEEALQDALDDDTPETPGDARRKKEDIDRMWPFEDEWI